MPRYIKYFIIGKIWPKKFPALHEKFPTEFDWRNENSKQKQLVREFRRTSRVLFNVGFVEKPEFIVSPSPSRAFSGKAFA